jgi:hypothetical protein
MIGEIIRQNARPEPICETNDSQRRVRGTNIIAEHSSGSSSSSLASCHAESARERFQKIVKTHDNTRSNEEAVSIRAVNAAESAEHRADKHGKGGVPAEGDETQ